MNADALRVEVDAIEVTVLAIAGTIPGVIPVRAAGRNGPGCGLLRSDGNGTWLRWQAPGSNLPGPQVDCSGDGTYTLEDGSDADKWLRIDVESAYLVAGPTQGTVYLTDVYQNDVAGDDVTAAEALAGDVETWTLSLRNDSDNQLAWVRAWLDPATPDLELSGDGVDWSAPTDEDAGVLVGDIEAGDSATLHIRRTITADATANPNVLTQIYISFHSP